MTRRKPKNRTVTLCEKIVVQDKRTETEIKAFVHTDRQPLDDEGLTLGPVCSVRITPQNQIAGTLLETLLREISEHISREVQTVEKVLAE